MNSRALAYLTTIIFTAFLLWLTSGCANASEIFAKYGLGVYGSHGAKTASLGVSTTLLQPLPWFVRQVEAGGYVDNRTDMCSAGFANLSYGIRVESGPLMAQVLWGIAGITGRDVMLGGFLQFNNDVTIGVIDEAGFNIGVNYKHLSSAGVFMPNQGRDFITIRIGVPIL